MSVRKRTWTSNGIEKSGWQADYLDANGKRRRKMFDRRKDADSFLAGAKVEVKAGMHVPDSETITVQEAGRLWLKSGGAIGLERSTIDQRRTHLDLHIIPFIGDTKLNKATVPWVRSFQDQLRDSGRSAAMVKRVTVSLGSIIADAQDRGMTVRNPVHERARSRRGKGAAEARTRRRLQVGVDIPAPAEIKALLATAAGRWRPFLMTAVFTGMRASELRGLPWSAVDLDAKVIHVRQRADAYNTIGHVKSEAGDRTIPVPPIVVSALREWKVACPRRDGVLDLVFPTGAGNIESLANIRKRGLIPTMIAAGVSVQLGRDEKGRPIIGAKYSGMHSLRHFFASWCINPVSAGGQGLLPKVVQERMGHSEIAMTMDTYGHLFPDADYAEVLATAANSLLA